MVYKVDWFRYVWEPAIKPFVCSNDNWLCNYRLLFAAGNLTINQNLKQYRHNEYIKLYAIVTKDMQNNICNE